MLFFIGLAIVIGSVLGGYMPHGDLRVLNQPLEFLIIFGAASGAFVLANPGWILKGFLSHFGRVMKGAPHSKESYLELLTLLYTIFRLAKAKGMLALEAHLEEPEDSPIFQPFPIFLSNHHAVDFLCDYLRLMTMGTDNPHELESLLDEDIETHHNEAHTIAHAVTQMSDGLPAFGIVAAVLGVIVTMSSISEPPEVLGGLIGAALVGTFLGILLAYGFVGPFGNKMATYADQDSKYFACMKAAILAHLNGYPPAVSIEFARKTLFSHERPSFAELEEAVQDAPNPASG
jgi:chemotaxis protein MotA